MVEVKRCTYCGEAVEADDLDGGEIDYISARCRGCMATGPLAALGCRDPEEDGPIDLEKEALELWTDRAEVRAIVNYLDHILDNFDTFTTPRAALATAKLGIETGVHWNHHKEEG